MIAQYWRHQSGRIYYVEVYIADGLVIGISAPLHPKEITEASLDTGSFHMEIESIDWANEHADEFAVIEPPYPGDR